MTWTVNWSDHAAKQLRKLDKKLQKDILQYMRDRVLNSSHPCDFGKPLQYSKNGLWRYRVRDARIVCQISDQECLILVLQVGHRKNIYRM